MTSANTPSSYPLRIGIDIGGTFTDFITFDPSTGEMQTFKLASTPHNPANAVLRGISMIRRKTQTVNIIHGSTVATNALLERKGARTALVTTQGFKDVIQIGRQNRPELYNLHFTPTPAIIPKDLRLEVDERVDHLGNIIKPLEDSDISRIALILENQSNEHLQADTPVESVAIVLLFSFLQPKHEERLAEHLRECGYFVSPSHEILPEYREYERTSTTVINAYVSPVLDRYLSHLEDALGHSGSQLQVMQSNGGSISITQARRAGVRCILSGPAGGVIGSKYVGDNCQESSAPLRLMTFDMGGTSTDVSLIDEAPQITTEAEVGGYPIRIPLLDIHTIGAGGGSIAYIDAGGALRVGPQSAGAVPGPACYGHGKHPTVTDAHILLGRIPPEYFLGGDITLYPERALESIKRLGREIGLNPIDTALGIIQIANAHMVRALRVISVERGYDPRNFTLLSFGGAGGLHAVDLAEDLGISKILVPPFASTLSAFGMLSADVIKDYTQTVMLPGDTPLTEINQQFKPILEQGRRELLDEGVDLINIELQPSLDIRYRGQSYELSVPFDEDFIASFHQSHQDTYGYSQLDAPIEIVNVRVQAIGRIPTPPIPSSPMSDPNPEDSIIDRRSVTYPAGREEVSFFRGESLKPGNQFIGPAVVVRADTTILINPTNHVTVDSTKNLLISIK